MMGDLKSNFYLGTPMEPKDYTYMHIPRHMLSDNIMQHYQLNACQNPMQYVQLLQAGLLANLQLQCFWHLTL